MLSGKVGSKFAAYLETNIFDTWGLRLFEAGPGAVELAGFIQQVTKIGLP
jgi:hypothetical protein